MAMSMFIQDAHWCVFRVRSRTRRKVNEKYDTVKSGEQVVIYSLVLAVKAV